MIVFDLGQNMLQILFDLKKGLGTLIKVFGMKLTQWCDKFPENLLACVIRDNIEIC